MTSDESTDEIQWELTPRDVDAVELAFEQSGERVSVCVSRESAEEIARDLYELTQELEELEANKE